MYVPGEHCQMPTSNRSSPPPRRLRPRCKGAGPIALGLGPQSSRSVMSTVPLIALFIGIPTLILDTLLACLLLFDDQLCTQSDPPAVPGGSCTSPLPFSSLWSSVADCCMRVAHPLPHLLL